MAMSLGTVLLCGGTGSFGRAFIRTLLARNLADRIVSLSRNAEMRYKLEQDFPDPRLLVVPGDVRQPADLDAAYDGPIDVIVLASAEKHIGTGQSHQHYVRSINVQGSLNVLDFAARRGVTRLLALSTDKACHPINAYGQSKADMERLLVQANGRDGVRVSLVRYGNVVGSSGSVLPLFIRQRAQGRLTVTDLRMTRYHMSLSDDADIRVFQEPGRRPVISAVGLVLTALDRMAGSEIFIPRIPSGTIANLAREVGPGCVIEEIGIRSGEKLDEELVCAAEADRCWATPDGLYVLLPTPEAVPRFAASRVPAGFTYTSGQDPQPLRVELETLA